MEVYLIETWIEEVVTHYKIWSETPMIFTSKNKARKFVKDYMKVEKDLYDYNFVLIKVTDYYRMYAYETSEGVKHVIKLSTKRTMN